MAGWGVVVLDESKRHPSRSGAGPPLLSGPVFHHHEAKIA